MRKSKGINKFAVVQALVSTAYYSAGDIGIVLGVHDIGIVLGVHGRDNGLLRVYWCCQRSQPVSDGIWYICYSTVKVHDNNNKHKSRSAQLATAEMFFNRIYCDKIL